MLFRERHRSRIVVLVGVVLLLVVVSATGCGKRRALAPVHGQVSYQGKPLRFGTVMFQPESGQPATGIIQQDGTFRMVTHGEGEGAALGKNLIRIACYEEQDPSHKFVPGQPTLGRLLIPERYLMFETSGLTIVVKPGANEPLVLELTDP